MLGNSVMSTVYSFKLIYCTISIIVIQEQSVLGRMVNHLSHLTSMILLLNQQQEHSMDQSQSISMIQLIQHLNSLIMEHSLQMGHMKFHS